MGRFMTTLALAKRYGTCALPMVTMSKINTAFQIVKMTSANTNFAQDNMLCRCPFETK